MEPQTCFPISALQFHSESLWPSFKNIPQLCRLYEISDDKEEAETGKKTTNVKVNSRCCYNYYKKKKHFGKTHSSKNRTDNFVVSLVVKPFEVRISESPVGTFAWNLTNPSLEKDGRIYSLLALGPRSVCGHVASVVFITKMLRSRRGSIYFFPCWMV